MDIPILIFAGILASILGICLFFQTKRGIRYGRINQLITLNKNPKEMMKFFKKYPKSTENIKKFLDENNDIKKKCIELYEFVSCYRMNNSTSL